VLPNRPYRSLGELSSTTVNLEECTQSGSSRSGADAVGIDVGRSATDGRDCVCLGYVVGVGTSHSPMRLGPIPGWNFALMPTRPASLRLIDHETRAPYQSS